MNENMKVAIQGDGTQEYGKRIMDYLMSLGAKNTLDFKGDEICFWAIEPNSISGNPWIGAYKSLPSGYRLITLDGTENVNIEQSNLLLLV